MIFKNIRKQYIIEQFVKPYKTHDNDVGSTSVQIARLSYIIKDLSQHMQNNKKDLHSLLGLKKMSSKRRKLLKFLKKTNEVEYLKLKSSLSIR